jgi:mutual gliding-motility protein MglA
MFINWARRELNLKVVYYGPPLSGKTTNLIRIHERLEPQRRGELISLNTSDDRTLYFDFLRIDLDKISGLTPRIHLYTVPGQPMYEASRRLVLRGADGIVFVADSAPERAGENDASWRGMHTHLTDLAFPLEKLAMVVQFNKQDLPNALSEADMRVQLNLNGLPAFGAVATQGKGVFNTLRAVLGRVVAQLQAELADIREGDLATSHTRPQ